MIQTSLILQEATPNQASLLHLSWTVAQYCWHQTQLSCHMNSLNIRSLAEFLPHQVVILQQVELDLLHMVQVVLTVHLWHFYFFFITNLWCLNIIGWRPLFCLVGLLYLVLSWTVSWRAFSMSSNVTGMNLGLERVRALISSSSNCAT